MIERLKALAEAVHEVEGDLELNTDALPSDLTMFELCLVEGFLAGICFGKSQPRAGLALALRFCVNEIQIHAESLRLTMPEFSYKSSEEGAE